jgi:hypothetical protein
MHADAKWERIGRCVTGIARDSGCIEWTFGRERAAEL